MRLRSCSDLFHRMLVRKARTGARTRVVAALVDRPVPPCMMGSVLPRPISVGEKGMDVTARSDVTDHWAGVAAVSVFLPAYVQVFLVERPGLRKSKPVMLGARLIRVLIAIAERGEPEAAASAQRL